MTKRSVGGMMFGVLFLIIGGLWLSAIVHRNEPFVPKETAASAGPAEASQGAAGVSLRRIWKSWSLIFRDVLHPAQLQKDMTETLSRPRGHIRPWHIVFFWMTVLVELGCSFAYIVGGLALLRRYPFSCRLAVLALFGDALFKGMILFYMEYIALPLQPVLGGNILENYYLGVGGIWIHLSAYLTGLVFYQPYGFIYLVLFLVYIVFGGYFFSREDTRAEFCRLQRGRC